MPYKLFYSTAAECWFIETPAGNVLVTRYRSETERRTEADGTEITIRRKIEYPEAEATARLFAGAADLRAALVECLLVLETLSIGDPRRWSGLFDRIARAKASLAASQVPAPPAEDAQDAGKR